MREHYIACGVCGQEIDMRDLGVVLAHEAPHDGPIDPKATPIVGSLGVKVCPRCDGAPCACAKQPEFPAG